MRRSTLLLTIGLVIGFALGVFVWQKRIGSRLRYENAELRGQGKEAEKLRSENAKLSSERVDPDELKRLRDGQTELLRLRGQVSQLRQRINEQQAATSRAATATGLTVDESTQLPIETFTTKTTATVGWQQTVVTGGWKLPSGNRAVLLLRPATDPATPNAVTVHAQILELSEKLMGSFDSLKTNGKEANSYAVLTSEQRRALMDNLQSNEEISVMSSPTVTTLSGRQAQVAVIDSFKAPNGENYSIGPVVDITPTILPDNQLVQLAVDARLSVPKPTK